MFKNYFKIAIRQLRKQRMYSVVKIGGFALSIAACLLIALYIRDELSYDKSYPDADRIFRVTVAYDNNGKLETGADWPPPMAKAMKQDFPEVEASGRLMPHELFYGAGSNEIRSVDKTENNYENKFSYADQDMLDILQVPMVYGDRSKALAEPNTMVISKSKADKYFPNQNPVGQLMILNDDKNKVYKIGGVMQDFPATSHIHYDFLLTLTNYELWKGEQQWWSSSNYYTYVRLKPHADPAQLQGKLKLILTKYYLPMMKEAGDKQADDLVKKAKLFLQPIGDIHLYSYNIDDGLQKGDIRFVWLFGAIACFILVIACINFINLSTAKSANRAREVGLRKVVGSYYSSLIKQFLTESLLFSVLSFVLGFLLAALLLPYFNLLSEKSLSIPWTAWWLFPVMIGASVIIGVLAGLYPAFYLSAFKPINVLKGQLSRGTKNSVLRNGLVVFQFATSIVLIIGTIVIFKQTHYILHMDLGYDKDQVMLIEGTGTMNKNTTIPSFRSELLRIPQVKNVTVSDYLPISGTKRDGNTFVREGRKKEDIGVGAQKWRVDYDYIKTLGMKIIQGRDFSRDMASDSTGIIINRTMASQMGLKQPIGQEITNGWEHFHVIGVMEDFHYETMKQTVGPLSLVLGDNYSTIVSVKMNGSDAKQVIADVSAVWKKFSPHQPLRFSFLDESFRNMYADVQRMGSIFTSFSLLAIVIACLGLFALSAFMAEQRNKEIGIRKVLGASVRSITGMLSKDFVRLVLVAFVIASPIAWWAMNQWLRDFQYRIHIGWWMFAVAGVLVVLIALATVSFQSVKAALMNPTKSLRSE
ncbi:MAG TPA: ABC transporter permease [Puia sp.]|nr:ABC transporter permease [Puia sp.]